MGKYHGVSIQGVRTYPPHMSLFGRSACALKNETCHGVGTPPLILLTPIGHQNMYIWQADGMHPAGKLTCLACNVQLWGPYMNEASAYICTWGYWTIVQVRMLHQLSFQQNVYHLWICKEPCQR